MEIIEIRILPKNIDNQSLIESKLKYRFKVNEDSPFYYKLRRKSIDSRGKKPVYVLRFQCSNEPIVEDNPLKYDLKREKISEIHIVGAGPAGYFAALEAIRCGLRPIIWERGKNVRDRRRDLRSIQQEGIINPDSNYCFGEGGAGTYSDGKLYTRSKKKGPIIDILKQLVYHGAKTDILVDAHPHIGSNKLPQIIANIRQTILDHGGKVHFNSRLSDINIEQDRITGIEINNSEQIRCNHLILATGHSARDIYKMLYSKDILIELKPFALGVRIEHPQNLIDSLQYGMSCRSENLPAAAYSLVHTMDESAVYSFCMCPGGLVVPASTAPGEIVINGMSLSRRDSPFANSGTVVSLNENEILKHQYRGPLAGMMYQSDVERAVFNAGNGSQQVPSQRLMDFCKNRMSSSIPPTSYIPGNLSAPLHEILPNFIVKQLQRAIPVFERKMKGYLSNEAVVMATESRTSAPVRIPRDKDSLQHPQIRGLYPCGEGAGYAGGIVSAAIDGQRVLRAIHQKIDK